MRGWSGVLAVGGVILLGVVACKGDGKPHAVSYVVVGYSQCLNPVTRAPMALRVDVSYTTEHGEWERQSILLHCRQEVQPGPSGQERFATEPWRKEFTAPSGRYVSITAGLGPQLLSIACTIQVDGQPWKEARAFAGTAAGASCSGNLP